MTSVIGVSQTCVGDSYGLTFTNHWGAAADPINVTASPATVFGNTMVTLERRDPGNIILTDAGGTGINVFNGQNSYKIRQVVTIGGSTEHIFKFSRPVDNLVIGVIDVDHSASAFTDNVEFKGYSNGVVYTIQAGDVVSGISNDFNPGQNSFTGNTGTSTYPEGQAQVTFPISIDSVVVVYSNAQAAAAGNQAISFNVTFDFCETHDMDRDGIADENDLDSDNDGIPNAIESACTATPDTLKYSNHWSSGEDPITDPASPATSFGGVDVSFGRNDPGGILNFGTDETGIYETNGNLSYRLYQNSVVGGETSHSIYFSKPVTNLVLGMIDVDAGGNFTDQVIINGYSNGKIYTLLAADIVSNTANNFFPGENRFTGISGTDTYPEGLAQATFPVPIDSVIVLYSNEDGTPSGGQAIGFAANFSFCKTPDSDNDGIVDQFDLDSDNDGIPDLVEAGGVDTNGDGVIDYPTTNDPTSMVDLDGDGLADTYDDTDTAGGTPGWTSGTEIGDLDSDSDGVENHLDLDSDNDGIADIVEAGGTDANGDGIADDFVDSDDDGFNDVVDGDVGNDGAENTANALAVTGADTNSDGQPNSYPQENDTDGDGILNQNDLDADNDGIADVVEAGGTDENGDGKADDFVDADNDGFNDIVDGDPTNVLPTGDDSAGANTSDVLVITGADTDGDGEPNTYPNNDTDADGNLDHLDLDADNDGIADVVEAGGTDENGDGKADDFVDADNDGFNDVVDGDPTNVLTTGDDSAGANTSDVLVITGADTDGDGEPNTYPNNDTDADGNLDHLDLDADNDGIADVVEAGGTDENGDGKADDFVDADNDGFNDVVDGDPTNVLPTGDDSAGENTSDVLVITGADTDGDGEPNTYPNNDTDSDGNLDHLDLDADNDGIADVVEAGGTDENGDGKADDFVDADNDGFNDVVDGDPTNVLPTGDDSAGANTSDVLVITGADTDGDGEPNTYPNNDTDSDGKLDHLDLDADNDGIADVVEAGGTDENGDGKADDFVDADGDGFNDVVDGDPTNVLPTGDDSAGANTSDVLVITGADTDGDGEPNTYPNNDTDSDGNLDHLDLDADNDGIADVVEAGGTDENGDGKADDFVDADNDGFNDVVDGDPTNVLPTGDDSAGANTSDVLVITGADTDGDGEPNTYPNNDTDSDGNLDHLDLDADNDGISDVVEAGGTDENGDGKADDFVDADNDGFNDVVDGDPTNVLPTGDDSAGANTSDVLVITGADTDGDGEPNTYPNNDTDSDGKLDHLDLDADNDGLPDVVEAGGIDTDGNGIADNYSDVDGDGFNDTVDGDPDNSLTVGDDSADTNTANAQVLTGADTDGNGKPNSYPNGDTDGDAKLDHLDLDSDNDGIPDLVEAGGIDTNGDGQVDANADIDQDGLADIFDEDATDGPGADGTSGTALVETNGSGTMVAGDDGTDFIDTDGDNYPDHLDLDADNDGIPDLIEAGGTSPNSDGMIDTGAAPWDSDDDGLADIYDENNSGTALVETTVESGTADGRVNSTESMVAGGSNNINADGDGFPNHLDLDADNDGITDVVENANGAVTADNTSGNLDGIVGDNAAVTDTDNDGWHDPSTTTTLDSDGDGLADYLDIDADNDGIVDYLEGTCSNCYTFSLDPKANTTDSNGDGVLDIYSTLTSANANGGTNIGNTPNIDDNAVNTTPDYLDVDTDNDGAFDWTEGYDANDDGQASDDIITMAANYETATSNGYYDNAIDSDSDGVPDYMDNMRMVAGVNEALRPPFLDQGSSFWYDDDNDGLVDIFDADQNGTAAPTPDNTTPLTGIDDFDWRDVSAVISLPVELTDFSGMEKDCDVFLKWVTSSEKDFDYFEIQWSGDGQDFSRIGFEKSNGNTNGGTYFFTDKTPSENNYYRLKMVDLDGSFEFSNVIFIQNNCSSVNPQLNVFPNPIEKNQVLNIEFLSEKINQQISIVDVTGRVVKRLSIETELGKNNLQLDISDFSSGLYHLQIVGSRIAKKLVILE